MHRSSQIWDPTIGAYRAQRLPIALSKSSVVATDGNDNAHSAKARHHSASSVSSRGKAVPDRSSSSSVYSYSSAQCLPPAFVSHPSNISNFTGKESKTLGPISYKVLPPEVYDCILEHLREIHENPRSQSCHTCHLRDLYSLSLANRAWDKAVVKRLLVISRSQWTAGTSQ